MQQGLVTTIIPVHNRPGMLREAVASVLAQTYRPIEVLIVDDASTDDTLAVAEELARDHEEIRVIRRAENGGAGAARESGRTAARGEFIQHLDSDDLLLPRKFEVQVAALRAHPECGAAYGWTRFRHRDGRVEERPWKRSGEAIGTMFPAMLALRWWDTPNPLYRASVIAEAGPWTGLRVEEDWEYDCRIASRGVRLAYCAEWVCEVREHDAPRLSGRATVPVLRDRARAHLLMLGHARSARLDPALPEMRQFARELFHLGRQCGAAGLADESRQLVEASRSIANAADVRVYGLLTRVIGWRNAGRVSAFLDGDALPFALLILLLLAQFALTLTHYARPIGADERYWIGKARYLTEHGRFPPIAPEALAAQKGAWGLSDWRPPGFPLFLAALSLGDFDDPGTVLRLRVTIAQFVLLAGIVIALFRIALAAGLHGRRRLAAAVILGAAPWTFGFADDMSGADAFNAFMISAALLLLWRWIAEPRHGAVWLFWASVAASLPLLIRPEMIVLAPVVVGLAMLLRWPPRLAEMAAAVAAFLLVAGAQVAYRASVTGEPGFYGGLHIRNRGAFHWASTWPGTEKEGYDFVYALTEARYERPLPDRAFANEEERRTVQQIIDRVLARGHYAEEDDAAFDRLARERNARAPWLAPALRVWHTAALWLNTENPPAILQALAPVPRSVRRPIYGALLLFRLACYALAIAATIRALIRLRRGEADAFDRLTLLMAGFILARSLLIGMVLNWKVYRYASAAWPAMLWCAASALAAARRSPRPRGADRPAPRSPGPETARR